MRDVVIAGYARSSFQPAHKGELAGVRSASWRHRPSPD